MQDLREVESMAEFNVHIDNIVRLKDVMVYTYEKLDMRTHWKGDDSMIHPEIFRQFLERVHHKIIKEFKL